MLLAEVTGTVVASQKDPELVGLKLLILSRIGVDGEPAAGYVVAADSVGAGVGDVVLYASGSSARQTSVTENRPCDAVVMAIVDSWDIEGREIYRKGH